MDSTLSRPVNEARKALQLLFEFQCKRSGRPSFEQFYPVNLDNLAEILGWRIERVDMMGHSESLDPVDARTDFQEKIIMIGIGEKIPQGRVNFTLAHELGHILLHGEKGLKALLRIRPFRDKQPGAFPRRPLEVEADRFAAELLMPERAVKHRFDQTFGYKEIHVDSSNARQILSQTKSKSEVRTSRSLAKSCAVFKPAPELPSLVTFFDVSPEAMANRLLELRLVLD